MTDNIATAIDDQIAIIDAALADMTARRLTLLECRTLLTAKATPKATETTSTAPIKAETSPSTPKRQRVRQRPQRERKSLRANLSADDIAKIRKGAADNYSHTEIASWFDGRLSRSTISNIINRRGCYATI
ncbi:hypothetical protein ACXY7D_11900 [Sphingomonas melonis]